MKTPTRRRFNQAVAATALFCMATQTTFAALLNFAQAPLFIGSNVPPKVMLTISKDQQLYKKAYNDYSDLDGDGDIETTYKHSIIYYGYFDSSKCYGYVTGVSRFEPQLPIAKDASGKFIAALCNNGATTNQWSGNFLNWVSMSRMDAVRKLLYGGLRVTDGASDTVLERAFLPTDAHAWAKYYNPDPTKADATKADYEPAINKLTPFNPPTTVSSSVRATLSLLPTVGDYPVQFVATPTGFEVGDQIRLASATGSITGPVLRISGNTVTLRLNAASIVGLPAGTAWTVTNLSATGISFCNLTTGSASGGTDSKSQTNTRAPLIRVAKGNFALWNANERWQCQWSEERSDLQSGFGGVRSNGNQMALSEIAASAENPIQSVHGLGAGTSQGGIGSQGQYFARVAVCVSDTALHGSEKCLQYPSGNYKPIGLLQTYGDTQRIHFGLMTGSYTKNITGGVLRKDVGTFTNEVLVNSTGAFNNATSGIVKTLNSMRVYGYNYIDGSYLGSSGDNCNYQLTDITEGSCTSWGNPMSEVFFEAIRYFAGQKEPTSGARYVSFGSKDTALGLPLVTNWTDPLSATTYCAPLNVLVFNASVSTNEDDLRTRVATDINSTRSVGALTTAIGDAGAEGISGGTYFAGKVLGVTPSGDAGFELCTPKTITALGDVSGICPEGPTLGGSYLIAGIAHHARTNRIRSDLDGSVPTTDVKSLKVTSYAVQLASNTPQLTIPVGTSRVAIQPLYRLNVGGGVGGGALVDMKYVRISPDKSSGKVYINWEDSEQGGDYDQDMWGTLEWSVTGNTITVTTNAVSASTSNPQGFGYTISGTTKDGPHFPSGILGFNFTDATGVLGCTDCQVASSATGQRGPQAVTYTLGATAASTLKDPLWYLAKYGGFSDANGDKLPNSLPTTEEWDKENNRTGELTPDGEPDNYFLVTNPLGMEAALLRAFTIIGQLASASSVAANSTSLKTGSAIYAARFDAKDWSGRLSAYLLKTDGSVNATAEWEASDKLPAANDRVILTYNDDPTVRAGVKFRWPDIGAKLQAALRVNPTNSVTEAVARGQERLNYLRGDSTLEGATTSSFRRRPVSKLGDIVNSSPAFVSSIPDDPIRDASYKAFRETFVAAPRKPMIYVGANDGMLHGFDATGDNTGGKELLAYVPSKTHSKLNQLTNPNYIHRYYIDSTPTVADVQIGTTWKTVLVGGLAAGGQGIYALDVTRPEQFAETKTSTVLWEFNDSDDADPSDSSYAPYGLGYVFGQPVVRKMSNGKWAAIVSAGYNNSEADGFRGSGRGYIFIIFLNGPTGANRTWIRNTDYVRLEAPVGTVATPNGLAPPFAADTNADGMVDYIYAGDLRGRFWKFDVTDSTNSALPGFKNAGNYANTDNRLTLYSGTQPITAQAQGTVHPTGQGYVLTFGTGKYIEPGDAAGPYTVQSFYGIWDKNNRPGKISVQSGYPTDQTKLFRQVIVDSGTFRSIEPGASQGSTAPVWTTHMGWFMDFPNSTATGERSVFTPLLVSGRLIFTTLIPSGGACQFGGTSYLMVLNPVTGGRFEAAVLDVNGDRVVTAGDTLPSGVYASGVQSEVGITPTPTVMGGRIPDAVGSTTIGADGGALVKTKSSRKGNMLFGGSSGPSTATLPIGLGNDRGRVAWREVLQK